jgi:hypothetical protein
MAGILSLDTFYDIAKNGLSYYILKMLGVDKYIPDNGQNEFVLLAKASAVYSLAEEGINTLNGKSLLLNGQFFPWLDTVSFNTICLFVISKLQIDRSGMNLLRSLNFFNFGDEILQMIMQGAIMTALKLMRFLLNTEFGSFIPNDWKPYILQPISALRLTLMPPA